MLEHSPAARNLYAEIGEAATTVDVLHASGPGKGSLKERRIKGRTYLYWQFRDLAGVVRHHYLGSDQPDARRRADALVRNRGRINEARPHLAQLAAAFAAAGGMRTRTVHFRVIEALAMGGIFLKGAVLVGSHAFVALGNLLGVTWEAATATEDIDIAPSTGVEIAVNPDLRIDVPRSLGELDMGFFLVPELDPRLASTSLQSNRRRVKVDFLIPLPAGRRTTGGRPVELREMGISAQPLRFLDYLLGAPALRAFLVGPYALPVLVPPPGRFALHKLVVAMERGSAGAAKAHKDVRQAAQLLLALAANAPGELQTAARAARARPEIRTRLRRSLARVRDQEPDAATLLERALRSATGTTRKRPGGLEERGAQGSLSRSGGRGTG